MEEDDRGLFVMSVRKPVRRVRRPRRFYFLPTTAPLRL